MPSEITPAERGGRLYYGRGEAPEEEFDIMPSTVEARFGICVKPAERPVLTAADTVLEHIDEILTANRNLRSPPPDVSPCDRHGPEDDEQHPTQLPNASLSKLGNTAIDTCLYVSLEPDIDPMTNAPDMNVE